MRARTALRTTVSAVMALLLLAVADPAHAEPKLPKKAEVVITGHGWGHGHGMSQYGAQGAALQGKTWREIVDFYYPGTDHGTTGGSMRVSITDDVGNDVVVLDRPGLDVRNIDSGEQWNLHSLRPRAERWRIVAVDGQRNRIDYRVGDRWKPEQTVRGRLEFTAGGPPLSLVLPGDRIERFRGAMRAAKPAGGGTKRDTVNVVPLEAYLRGVVPQESPSSWEKAALQAQAIAARSYAAYERIHDAHGHFDVFDNTYDQAYGGVDAERRTTDRAIEATSQQVLTYQGEPAFTQFSSSMGGYTQEGSEPYLVSQADPYEKHSGNPNMTWRQTLTIGELERAIPKQAGRITGIKVTKDESTGGRYVDEVHVTGSKRGYKYSGWDFRQLLDLQAPWFDIKIVEPKKSRQ